MLNGLVRAGGGTLVVVVFDDLVVEYDSSIELPLPTSKFCQNNAKTIAISPAKTKSVREKQMAQVFKRDARF